VPPVYPFLWNRAIAVVSFDIDGTMEFGSPPGPIPVELVSRVAALGHIVGCASDRTRSDQEATWRAHGIDLAFLGGKHHLHDVRARFRADHYWHIGDTDVDAHFARIAGFEFVRMDALAAALAAGCG
jgi:phosphoglycolate phosphatase-like HAD superfamily hydrolase